MVIASVSLVKLSGNIVNTVVKLINNLVEIKLGRLKNEFYYVLYI